MFLRFVQQLGDPLKIDGEAVDGNCGRTDSVQAKALILNVSDQSQQAAAPSVKSHLLCVGVAMVVDNSIWESCVLTGMP